MRASLRQEQSLWSSRYSLERRGMLATYISMASSRFSDVLSFGLIAVGNIAGSADLRLRSHHSHSVDNTHFAEE
jgi:hypothetical protein